MRTPMTPRIISLARLNEGRLTSLRTVGLTAALVTAHLAFPVTGVQAQGPGGEGGECGYVAWRYGWPLDNNHALMGTNVTPNYAGLLQHRALPDLTTGAPDDSKRPPVRTQSDSALELTELATYTLPPGMTVEGAALSPSGARVVVWGSRPRGFLYFERGVGGARSVPRERLPPGEIAGVAFLDDSTLGIIHAGGRVSAVEWGSWKHRTPRVIPVSGIRSAALGDGGWWLLAEGTGEDAALHFLPGDGVSSPVHVMPLAASPDRAFLATAGTDALVALRDSPFLVWRIGVDGDVVAGMQPDRPPSNGTAERDPPPRWMGLSALSVAPGVIQVIADVTSDDRLLVTYDDRGDVASSRVLQAPFGLIAVASHAQVLAALRTFEASEIVVYSWRWRLRAPARGGSLPERRISNA